MLRRLCKELRVPWKWVASAEVAFFEEIIKRVLQASKNQQLAAEKEEGGGSNKFKKWAIVGGGAVVGGAIIGLSGGLAVPALVAGLGMAGTTVGVGTLSVALSAGTVSGISAVVGVSFGGYGAGLVGSKVARRIGEVQEFEFDIVDVSPGLPIVVGVTGWLNNSEDNPWKAWDEALGKNLSDGGDALALRWETKEQLNLGNIMQNYLKSEVKSWAMQTAGDLVLGAAFASLTWPRKLISMSGWIDNTWAMVQIRADQAGEMLADTLMKRAHGYRPITLVGFGMGARLIFKCLLHLAKNGAQGRGIVETAICLGTPDNSNPQDWETAASVCGHRLVNGYCQNDWVLGFIYRAGQLLRTVAGLQAIQPVEGKELHPALENLDLTGALMGHWDYRDKLPELVRMCGLSTGVSDPPPPPTEFTDIATSFRSAMSEKMALLRTSASSKEKAAKEKEKEAK